MDERPESAGEGAVLARTTDDVVPSRAADVQLLGEMKGSGYRRAPALVRRSDGQTLQLTPLLYLVLEAIDGTRNYDEVAAHASQRFGKSLSCAGWASSAWPTVPSPRSRRPTRCSRCAFASSSPTRWSRVGSRPRSPGSSGPSS
jgi:hypothetical protein